MAIRRLISCPALRDGHSMQSADSRKPYVLAIDDEQAVRSLLETALPLGGLHVLLAVTGLEGIEIFKRRHNDIGVVLLDIFMPGLNGIETCRLLRELDPGIPVCFMTGHNSDEMSNDLREFQAPILQKPFGLVALRDMLHGLINSRAFVSAV
jgi:two-component system, cell cycle sensor histidine kinase and response regulator CckA